MTNDPQKAIRRLGLARQLLATSAWILLAAIVLGFITSADVVETWLREVENTPLGSLLILVVLLTTGAAGLGAWAGALIYAWTAEWNHQTPRWLVLSVLVLGNFVASFFYYFIFVFWQSESGARGQR